MTPQRVTIQEGSKSTRYEIKHDGAVYEFCREVGCTVGYPLSEVGYAGQKSPAQKVRDAARRMS